MLVGATLMISNTHGRRVAKMTGAGGDAPVAVFPGAGAMWTGLLAMLVASTAALLFAARGAWLFDLWSAGVGAGFVAWGRRADFGWYVGLGVLLVAAAAADVALTLVVADVPRAFRVFVAGVVVPLAALATNRRYLWFRP